MAGPDGGLSGYPSGKDCCFCSGYCRKRGFQKLLGCGLRSRAARRRHACREAAFNEAAAGGAGIREPVQRNIRACGYWQGREGPGGERGAGLSPLCQKDFLMRRMKRKKKDESS